MVIFSQVKTYEDYFPYIDRRFNAMYYTFFALSSIYISEIFQACNTSNECQRKSIFLFFIMDIRDSFCYHAWTVKR